jgi:hypothetical protein
VQLDGFRLGPAPVVSPTPPPVFPPRIQAAAVVAPPSGSAYALALLPANSTAPDDAVPLADAGAKPAISARQLREALHSLFSEWGKIAAEQKDWLATTRLWRRAAR